MSPYLVALRAKYEGLRKSIEGLQTRAVSEKRDLDDNERELVRKQGEEGAKIAAEITSLTEIELRDARVTKDQRDLELAMRAAGGGTDGDADADSTDADDDADAADGDKPATRGSKLGGATTNERDPGHYRRRGSQFSFFRDLVYSHEKHDREALRRLAENERYQMRAAGLTTGSNGPGVVPPKWLTDEFAEIARQGRALANVVRNIPLGSDPRPLTLPKQTAGTDAAVLDQTLENDAIDATDLWDSATDTVSPKPVSGAQVVSRQMIDMSDPAIDLLIFGDLTSAYNLKVEKKVGAAITTAGTAGGGSAIEAFDGVGSPVTDPSNYSRAMVRAAIAVRQNRKLGANLFAMSVGRYGVLLDERDTTGRPLMPEDSAGPMNVAGIGSINVDGRYRGLAVVASEGMLLDTQLAAVRSSDVLLFESDLLRFRYEEILGPQSIKLGIWAYVALLVRYGNAPVKLVNVTEES